MSLIQINAERPPIGPEIIGHIGSWPISNSLMMIWLITLLTILVGWYLSRHSRLRPSKGQVIAEMIYEQMYNLIGQLTGNDFYTAKLFPLIGTLFIFIGLANLLTLFIPFLGAISYAGQPLFRTATADFNTTLSLALAMVLMVQVISLRHWGVLGHLGKYFQFSALWHGFKQGFGKGMMSIIDFLIGLLDIVTEVARVISLSIRLFGNMFAGEMLAIIIIGFIAYGLPAIWMAMGLLVGVIQAMVFGSLTAAYYMLALPEEKQT
ncbi:MAG: F0F1 ATP synthase subunit A [Candidatus Komeilibacteria bacterium]